jgi:hypothetical protein
MYIPELSKDELGALWEGGVPMDDAWVEFAIFFDRFALRALRTDPGNDAKFLGLNNPRYRELNLGWLPCSWDARQKKLAITTANERINLLGEIYAGRLWAIGCRGLSTGFDELVRVPRQFFFFDETEEHKDRPDIRWGNGELTVGDSSYFEIRVARAPSDCLGLVETSNGREANRADLVQPIQEFVLDDFVDKQEICNQERGYILVEAHTVRREGVDDETQVQDKRRPGRPTMREPILDAIADYVATDPKMGRPPTVRYRAYRTYLSNHGYERGRVASISEKTFEKFETEFRKTIN